MLRACRDGTFVMPGCFRQEEQSLRPHPAVRPSCYPRKITFPDGGLALSGYVAIIESLRIPAESLPTITWMSGAIIASYASLSANCGRGRKQNPPDGFDTIRGNWLYREAITLITSFLRCFQSGYASHIRFTPANGFDVFLHYLEPCRALRSFSLMLILVLQITVMELSYEQVNLCPEVVPFSVVIFPPVIVTFLTAPSFTATPVITVVPFVAHLRVVPVAVTTPVGVLVNV